MAAPIDHTKLHRTAKYFMDSGKAGTHREAMAFLERFGLTIFVGKEVATSSLHQTALLTLVNLSRRTLLGGVHVVGVSEAARCVSPLAKEARLSAAVEGLGGVITTTARNDWPAATIGHVNVRQQLPVWRLTWEGWRGGIVPRREDIPLDEKAANPLAPILAASICAAEAFAFHAEDHAFAGFRTHGLSLWQPGRDWLMRDDTEPKLHYLPSDLWLIGLGNLGQAYAWILASLPYPEDQKARLVLQDFDKLALSNDSTSVLSFARDIGCRKSRVIADWLDARGFNSFIEERQFGISTRRSSDEPGVALCGVDNAVARMALEDAGFDLVVEAGLGAGPEAFRSFAMHTFPATRSAREIWARNVDDSATIIEQMPAYQRLKDAGMDSCGLTRLASRTVGVPFVGLIAACLVVSELLRRLHGGVALEFTSGSVLALHDLEVGQINTCPYAFGHVPCSIDEK